jgi:hypothetical protein
MATETAVSMKLCTGPCCRPRSLNEFRPRSKDSVLRHSQCNECHALNEKARREPKRRGEVGRLAGELRRVRDTGEAIRVVQSAMRYFRGRCGPRTGVVEDVSCRRAREPTAAKVLFPITNLNRVVNPPPQAPSMMSDEDMNERVKQLGGKMLAKAAAEVDVGS